MHRNIFDIYLPQDKSNLISLLKEVQDTYGYLPKKTLPETTDYLDIHLNIICRAAKVFNQFRFTTIWKNIIQVCKGTACHVNNSANILITLENELVIRAGGTTRDKLFKFETAAYINAYNNCNSFNKNKDYK